MAVSASEYLFYDFSISSAYSTLSPIAPVILGSEQYLCVQNTKSTPTTYLFFHLFGVLINNSTGVRGNPQRIASRGLLTYADGIVNLYQCPSGYSMEGKLFIANSSADISSMSIAVSAAGV